MITKPQKLFNYLILPKNKSLIKYSKELRKQGILSEVLLWKALKNKEYICNYDIDRQVIIGNYIVDFFIAELGFIIEIDGSTHDFKYEDDKLRDKVLKSFGLEIIRILHIDVLQNIDEITIFIQKNIETRIKVLKNSPRRVPSNIPPRKYFKGGL
jgi:very-short-patch-repair endonuclease